MSTLTRPPAGLQRAGRQLWRRVVADYDLLPYQLSILALACCQADRAEQARQAVAAGSLLVAGSMGQDRAHPLVGVEREAALACLRALRELGLNPSTAEEATSRPPRLHNRYIA